MKDKIAEKILKMEKDKLMSKPESDRDWELITALDLAIEALEDRPQGEWITIEAGEELLEDHYWYLIVHKDYGTPMKAIYHSDCCPHFTFFTARGEKATYLSENKITHYMELPDIPQEAENE